MKTGSRFPAAPDRAIRIGQAARFALAGIRVINGGIALIAPGVIIRRFDEEPAADNAAVYGLRMFGVRTVVLSWRSPVTRSGALSGRRSSFTGPTLRRRPCSVSAGA